MQCGGLELESELIPIFCNALGICYFENPNTKLRYAIGGLLVVMPKQLSLAEVELCIAQFEDNVPVGCIDTTTSLLYFYGTVEYGLIAFYVRNNVAFQVDTRLRYDDQRLLLKRVIAKGCYVC
jgi:hypothetical protein